MFSRRRAWWIVGVVLAIGVASGVLHGQRYFREGSFPARWAPRQMPDGAFVICRGARPTGTEAEALVKELREFVSKSMGPIAKPDDIRFADGLPKTRSGKIMRRLLRSIAKGEDITQDTSTLENPAILEQLKQPI